MATIKPRLNVNRARSPKVRQAHRAARVSGLSGYLNGLGRFRHLTREEEIELSRLARRGDRAARDRLVTANLALVVSIARKYAHGGSRIDDLVQEGNIGLLKATEHYNPKKGTRFATYAVWWIRAYIQRHVHDNRSQVRGGESQRASMSDLSLDVTLADDGDVTHLERLVDERDTPEEGYLRTESDAQVRAALLRVRKRLGDLGWDILEERLKQDSPRTLEEIGKRWGVSRERVRQVELRTKSFLSRYLEPLAA
ncbi:MAG: sigma-70 family RNA polymerase sigma factor [Myxococcales bacterium]